MTSFLLNEVLIIAQYNHFMNNITVFGGIVAVLLVAGLLYYISQNPNLFSNTATSTPVGSIDNTDNTDNTPTGAVPGAITGTTASPTDTTVVVVGTVTPNGALTNYWYEFGTTVNLGSKTSSHDIGSGYTSIPSPAYITGLTKKTTYFFRLVAQNKFGTVAGSQHSFQTTDGVPAPVGGAPIIKTTAASSVYRNTASVNGEVNPNRATTQYWFEYGKSRDIGNVTGLAAAGSGSANGPASAALTSLDANTTYYYRINAQNQFGTINGAILNFKTAGPAAEAAPSATTRSATAISTSTATVRGTVDPNGAETKYWFEYSTDALLGAVLVKTTPQKSAGAGTNSTQVQTNVSGLNSNTTYYFRIVAENNQGIERGDREMFETD